MARLLAISDGSSTITATLTNYNPTVTFNLSNPIALVPPPTPDSESALAYANINAIAINIGMMLPTVTITFIDKSGIGDSPLGSTYVDSSTFQKLWHLAYIDKNKKKLWINSSTVWCQITDYKATVVAGQKDVISHMLQLALVSAESM